MDATIAAAPRRRNTEDEKKTIKDGRIPEEWKTKPKKLAQKDRDARWTLKRVKARPAKDGEKGKVEYATPSKSSATPFEVLPDTTSLASTVVPAPRLSMPPSA